MADEIVIVEETGPSDVVVIVEPETVIQIVEGQVGPAGRDAPGVNALDWTRNGQQFVSVGATARTYEYDATVLGIRVWLNTPAVGSDFVVAVRRNGAPWIEVTVPEGEQTPGFLTALDDAIIAGDRATVDVEQVGSVFPGADLTVTLWTKVTV